MSSSTVDKPIQKKCPECGAIIAWKATECCECGHKFELPSDASRAPRKNCPNCGNAVPIRAVTCNECGHTFTFKSGTAVKPVSKPKKSEAPAPSPEPVPRATESSSATKDHRNPLRALLLVSISLVLYNALLIFLMALLYRNQSGWFAILTTLSIPLSGIAGGVIGHCCDGSYGKYSLGAGWAYLLIGTAGTVLLDYIYFSQFLDAYSGEWKWGMGALTISISMSVIVCVIALLISLKSDYCPSCHRANMLTFSHTGHVQERYGYEYQYHASHKETARVHVHDGTIGGTYADVEYTVPAYRENLGLHKYTSVERVYVCSKCRREVSKYESKEERV